MGCGDELMAAGRARVMHERTGKKVEIIDRHGVRRWSPIWDGNPCISWPGESGSFEAIRNAPGCRPYILRKTWERWTWDPQFRPDCGKLYFSEAERAYANFYSPQIVVEPNLKSKASPNKQWGRARWRDFVSRAHLAGMELVQLGPPGTALLPGVRLIETPDFRTACAVLARSRAYVGHEGGLHHAAAALGVPAVVIFGGYIGVETTGYPMHRNLGVSVKEACGMRVPCKHCASAMASITPERVFGELEALL